MTDSKSSCRFFAFHNEVALIKNNNTAIKPKPSVSLVLILKLLIFIYPSPSSIPMHNNRLHYLKKTYRLK